MPTYDYECSSCSHRTELFEKADANPLKKCPKCGKRTHRRLPGIGAGVLFKGSGFYATDYGRKASPEPEKKKTARKEKPSGDEKKK